MTFLGHYVEIGLSDLQLLNSSYVVLHFSKVSKVLFQISVNRIDAVSIIVTIFISISVSLSLSRSLAILPPPYLSLYLSLPISLPLYVLGRERDRESDNVLSLSGTSLWAYTFVRSVTMTSSGVQGYSNNWQ